MATRDSALTSRAWKKLKESYRAACANDDRPCWICQQPIDYALRWKQGEKPVPEAFEVDHYHPRSTHPHLTYDPANLRPSHVKCNRARGNKMVTADLGTPSRQWLKG
ncbi:HNH endonuclease [Dermabacter hominis]